MVIRFRCVPENGSSVLVRAGRGTRAHSLSLFLRNEDTASWPLFPSQEETLPPGTESARILTLDFSASRIMRNKLMLCQSPNLFCSGNLS